MLSIRRNKAKHFKNWSSSVYCQPGDFVAAGDLPALIEVVDHCRAEGKTIRLVGSGHSFTPLVATTDLLLSIDHLSGIESIDHENRLVTVWAGTRLKDLAEALFQYGYALENLGDINVQTLAGAISTGTHGTGIDFGSVATQVHDLTILTGTGELLHISPTENAHLLEAVKVSLGMLGIIVKVTLKVLPAYQLIAHSYRENFIVCLNNLDQLTRENRNFEFFWFPYTNTVQIKTLNENQQVTTEKGKQHMLKKLVIENGLFYGMSEVSRIFPKTAKLISNLSAIGVPVGLEVDKSHELYATPRLVKFNEMEYSVPKDQMANVLYDIDALIRKYNFAVHFPIECRYVKRDDIWLSPSYERDAAYIAVHMYKGMEFQAYFEAVEKIFLAYGGRPHWGKMHTLGYEELRNLYPKLDDFLEIRAELDEDGMFLNEYVRDMLQI